MAQNMFDSLDEGNYDTTTNFLANAMKAGGGILDAFNGMSTSVWYSTGQHSAR